jgi:hypothetical protein
MSTTITTLPVTTGNKISEMKRHIAFGNAAVVERLYSELARELVSQPEALLALAALVNGFRGFTATREEELTTNFLGVPMKQYTWRHTKRIRFEEDPCDS